MGEKEDQKEDEEGEEVKRHDDEYDEDDEDDNDDDEVDEDEEEEEEDEEDKNDEEDEDEYDEDEMYRPYMPMKRHMKYFYPEEEEEESTMRNRAYPFRKRSLEEIKAKKQDLDKDNDGIAGEQFWLGGEGEQDPKGEEEEESAVKKMDRNMENIYSRLGYLEFQPH